MSLVSAFTAQIADGLHRNSIISASEWAQKYRIMGQPEAGKWGFRRRPFLEELHNSKAEINVIRKAAQLGLSETALNIIFYEMDMNGRDSLYVLPTATDAQNFSAGRFDPAIELSPHIEGMFSDVKNKGHKRAGTTNLYIRGGKSDSQLKSIPVGVLVLDEVDEMSRRAIALAKERMSGQDEKLAWFISTPTVPKGPISAQFDMSTQEWYYFKCPSCSRQITLRYPDSFVMIGESLTDPDIGKSHIQCYKCKAELPHQTKPDWLAGGKWQADFADRVIRGFALNQLFSPMVTPFDFALSYIEGLSDPAADQEFHNSKCGIPFIVAGGQVLDEEIEQCIKNYRSGTLPKGTRFRSIGVDVGGTWLHYEVDEWVVQGGPDINATARCQVVEVGKVHQFEDIDPIMGRLGVHFGIVDGNPEKRKALELARRFYGRFAICFITTGLSSRGLKHNEQDQIVTYDRTSWMDLALGRFRNKTIGLPLDISLEYRDQIKDSVRRYRVTDKGIVVAEYMSSHNDHFSQTRTYAELALTTFMPLVGASHNIESVL